MRAARLRPIAHILAATLALLGGGVAVAHAHSEDAALRVDPPVVTPDGGVVVSGHGLDPSSSLRLTLEGGDARVALGDVRVDLAGAFEVTVLVPVDVPPGAYSIRLSEDGALVLSEVLVVDPAAGRGVPVDRGFPPGVVLFGALSVGLGLVGGLRLVGRRRRPEGEPHRSG